MEMTKSEMRAAHARILDELREENVRIQRKLDYADRRLLLINSNFQTLWGDEHTLRMRFSWLETAATDVVNACPKHLPGEIQALADELGIEVNQNGDT